MIFCGQCGLQLAPGTTHCPRCGATVDEANVQTPELHADDATIASHSLIAPNPPGLSPASPPQPMILRPGDRNDYGTQAAYDATSRMEAPNYSTQMAQNPNIGSTYSSPYQAQGGYPDLTNRGPGTYGGGYPMSTQQAFQQPYAQGTNKARATALVLVVLGVVLLVIAGILLVLQHSGAIAEIAPANSHTAIITTISAPPISETQSGQQIIRIDISGT